ncbi:MAG: hypothetical protein GF331_06890 [Chitinivibrionales bacterium]|nr:hypothetical protein [Chitinivibrionales bacterium]
MKLPPISRLDSSTTLLLALAARLHGDEFRRLGVLPPLTSIIAPLANYTPEWVRAYLYRLTAIMQAIPVSQFRRYDTDALCRWVVSRYPRTPFPAVAIGSSNGALMYLFAAMGIPWLPQTFLVPVHRRMGPDAIEEDMRWGARQVREMLARNPSCFLQQMHDPVQDRLMIQHMAMFRLKLTELPDAYERFLRQLPSGASIYVVDCGFEWPRVRLDERFAFQVGGLGELAFSEYRDGSERVAAFLRSRHSGQDHWRVPTPTESGPEAEWGYDHAMTPALRRLARQRGLRLVRMRFDKPEDISPLVADCYRWWYARRGIGCSRLIASSFVMVAPTLMVRTGSIPLWLSFNTRYSAQTLQDYLDRRGPFDECFAMLMADGLTKVGDVPISRWVELLRRAAGAHGLLGIDPRVYPADYAAFSRYQKAFAHTVRERIAEPSLLSPAELDGFLRDYNHHSRVEIREDRSV